MKRPASPQATATALTWEEVAAKRPVRLNLGGCGDCHPRKGYEGFVSVDTRAPREGWWIPHDLTTPIPLPDASVEAIHTEELLQFLPLPQIEALIAECHRLLVPGGTLRLCTCDYNHPKDRAYLERGSTPHAGQLVMLTEESMRAILARSPFGGGEFLQYWREGAFHHGAIDYAKGHVRRTPEHDPRNRRAGLRGWIKNAAFVVRRGFRLRPGDAVKMRGNPLFVTSLVVDCVKRP